MPSWFSRRRSRSPLPPGGGGSSSVVAKLRQEAEQQSQRGDLQGAINTLSTAARHDDKNVSVLLARALAYMDLSTPNYDAALLDADASIDIEPGSSHGWSMKGNALSGLGRYAEAEQALQHAIRLAGPMDKVGPQQMLNHVKRMKANTNLQTPGADSNNLQLPIRPVTPATSSSPVSSPPPAVSPSLQPGTPQFIQETNPVPEPPPQYTASPGASTSRAGPSLGAPSSIQNSLTSLSTFMSSALIGSVKLTPYTLPGQIDFVKLTHYGLTATESLLYDTPAITFAHLALTQIHINRTRCPGSTFLDNDTESALGCVGVYPGTRSVAGASEEYREAQLVAQPMLKLTLEAPSGPPEMTLKDIVERINLHKRTPGLEDDAGLFRMLGITSAPSAMTRLNKIDQICLKFNRGSMDSPGRYKDFSKIRNFVPHFLGSIIGFKDFLFQILLGVELYVRTMKEPLSTAYNGIITESISAMMVAAVDWMESISIQVSPNQPSAPTTSTIPPVPRYQVIATRSAYFKESLMSFAESIQWPYMQETRHFLENASKNLGSGPPIISNDTRDWLYGLRLPGKLFRHRLMCCLVDSSASVRSIGPAPFYLQGIILGGKSYWPDRSVLGRVLGGLPGMKWHCGWIGPVTAPVSGVASPSWIYAEFNWVPVPLPATNTLSSAQALGFDSEEEMQQDDPMNLIDTTRWKGPLGLPAEAAGTRSSASLKAIRLTDPRTLTSTTVGGPQSTQYRVSVDFSITSAASAAVTQASYILYSTPLFVTAPKCLGDTHPIYEFQSRKLIDGRVKVANLMGFNPTRDQMVLIDARGSGEDAVARAWCSERRRNAVINRTGRCCFACAVLLSGKIRGLGYNTLIWI